MRDRVLELATADERVVAAAVVGSLAFGGGDEWSDLDLTFGVADDVPVGEVIDDWTRALRSEFDAANVLDLEHRGTTYRVFMLPRLLQVDLSFAPARDFRQGSPKFEPLFGEYKVDHAPPASADDLFGWAVVHARHARIAIERRKPWEAEFSISTVRDNALKLACLHRDLPTGYAKGFDALPAEVRDALEGALVRSLDFEELSRALSVAIAGLVREAHHSGAAVFEHQLRLLTDAR